MGEKFAALVKRYGMRESTPHRIPLHAGRGDQISSQAK
jgi:hypothetical protein